MKGRTRGVKGRLRGIGICRYCDRDPEAKKICGQCQEFYNEDEYGRPLPTKKR